MSVSLDGFVAGSDQSRGDPVGVGGLKLQTTDRGRDRHGSTVARFRPRDVELLNRLAQGPVLPVGMDVSGAAVLPVVSVDQALAHIAREGVALLTGPLRARVRECAATDCQLLFVDASRPGRRQWCSMAGAATSPRPGPIGAGPTADGLAGDMDN